MHFLLQVLLSINKHADTGNCLRPLVQNALLLNILGKFNTQLTKFNGQSDWINPTQMSVWIHSVLPWKARFTEGIQITPPIKSQSFIPDQFPGNLGWPNRSTEDISRLIAASRQPSPILEKMFFCCFFPFSFLFSLLEISYASLCLTEGGWQFSVGG